jgi:hypothetical protein
MKIWYLIEKDLRMHWLPLLVILLIQIGGVALFWLQLPHVPGLIWLIMNGTMLVGDFLLCYRVTVHEEKNKAYIFLQTLPVTVDQILRAKFLAVALMITANALVLDAVYSLMILRGGTSGETIPGIIVFLLALCAHLFFATMLVAMAMLFSSERAIWIPFPALFLVMSALLNYKRILAWAHLEAMPELLANHLVLDLLLLSAGITSLLWLTKEIVCRKRMII